jgi:Mg-chelatase subunit ChlD
MLLEPEVLEAVTPDVNLVANIMALNGVIPEKTKQTARLVVKKVVDELMARLQAHTQQAIQGALNRSTRTKRPRHADIDWNRTIRANLKHYQTKYRTIIPETRIGYGRKQRNVLRDIVLCIDQSGSMANSIVYSSIFGAVMASMPAVSTRMVVFDTAVVDLTDQLSDPVDVLFGVQLGGGTDITAALTYCQNQVRVPSDTILVLISDLIEGNLREQLLKRVQSIVGSGVQMLALLALSDEGAPCFDHEIAGMLGTLGVPAFACTPDLFPDLMAAAISRQDILTWAATNGIVTSRASDDQ